MFRMKSVNGKYLHMRILGFLGILLAACFIPGLQAQEQVFPGQHLYNRMVYNPAFAGDREIPGFTMISRQQWISWEGSPSSNVLMAHTLLKNKNVGVGVSLSHDRMGPFRQTGLSGAYSYTLQINETNKLVMGLQGEMMFRQIQLSQLELIDQGDLQFADDPGLKFQPNVGMGINYILGKYQVHLSLPRLLNSNLSPYEGETSRWSVIPRRLYLGAFSSFDLQEDLKIVPSVLLAFSRGSSLFGEMAGTVLYQNRFGAGLYYRLNKTLGALIRYHHQERFVFGYAYDVSFNITRYNAGTHELYLGYNLPFNRIKTLSPRRF